MLLLLSFEPLQHLGLGDDAVHCDAPLLLVHVVEDPEIANPQAEWRENITSQTLDP